MRCLLAMRKGALKPEPKNSANIIVSLYLQDMLKGRFCEKNTNKKQTKIYILTYLFRNTDCDI